MIASALFFAWGLSAPFWRSIGRAVTKRTGSVAIGLFCGALCLLAGTLPLEIWRNGSSSPLAAPIIAFVAGAMLGCCVREWREGTSKIDILVATATVGSLFWLFDASVR